MARRTEETLDASIVSGAPASSAPDSPTLAAGEVVANRYRLIRLIARGGMGEVYEADDLELGGRIAIKTIRAERVGDPESVARLKQEILAARRVTHPNVVRLFDVGFHVLADQREVALFTMELLDGETLDARIHRLGKLPVADALAIARQLAAALDAAHDAGLVHRDFKSQNVILVGDRAIVTDFGLARDHLGGEARATVEFIGTPAYMAPEQVSRGHKIGPAADIYALGVVLYEMVTGDWPFRRDSALATAAARLTDDPPSPRVLAPDLPVAWEAAILRCLARDPAKRFARASDVIAALVGRRPMPWRRLALAAGAVAVLGGGYAALRMTSTPSCGAPVLPDLYVDQAARPGGNGSRGCPVKTISDALAITAERKVIHVAAGLYDRAHAERFPLEIRGAVALVGAGIDRTTISGVGPWDGKAPGGTLGGTWQASIVTGDTTQPIEIASLSITSGLPRIEGDVTGIACTRGSATSANTRVHDVAIGSNYSAAIFAGTEERPADTACNLDVDRAHIHDSAIGIHQIGCGTGSGRIPVGVAVHRSTFAAIRAPNRTGIGINMADCQRLLLVEESSFTDSDAGINMIRHFPETFGKVLVRNNQFQRLARHGISMFLAVQAELHGNYFAYIAGSDDTAEVAPAVALISDGLNGPSVVLRGNQFSENDRGLDIAASIPEAAAVVQLDAGRTDDPGKNLFFCNAAPKQSQRAGGDVAVRSKLAGNAKLELAGNTWDHAPPTTAAQPKNGLDILSATPLATPGAVAAVTRTCPD